MQTFVTINLRGRL
ncbi:hypothetical protein E2C01_093364 [Portunus trituberculatus]|uniref:Uncharacterized protein n=1 Tax=Portunus trituberculatus TaxID=210409 RepID=A0A5B7JTT4_PORTR|nr:hypothetical protein [Portunus trituberculatus]